MPKKNKIKDVDRPELHVMHYLSHSDYKLRMLTCDHPVPPDRYNDRRYVKCHIMLLIGTILFGDKSGAGVHWKFLPLLREFGSIIQYSWGSACLAHLYRALCRASRVDFKEIDGPLTLLLGFVQGVPHEERNLDKAHGEVLTGPKNLNWATTPTHYSWVMHWTNRYHHVLSELPVPSQHPLDTYMHWYRGKFGDRLNLSNLVGEENDEGSQDLDEGNQDTDEGNQDMDEGVQDMDDDNEEQEPNSPQIPPPNPLP
ncbi:hypothetical protein Ahy_B10g101424 [Arachis hypogaea]|uniref:Aminotransferase-like plant mobile domain-containing protein n=1 Tax=Arachis hypogaea TaxID=3818 RepID=A0A444WZH4_ARAHY|nr:hypothetical protein Ahy_B10g101424 [Arachis hypogaea]